jgi:hypothetical protein
MRELNEQLTGLEADQPESTIVCECSDLACTEPIVMSDASYEAIRDDARLFAVKPGHEDLQVEEVVERHADHLVVRKAPGVPAAIAEATDPRR